MDSASPLDYTTSVARVKGSFPRPALRYVQMFSFIPLTWAANFQEDLIKQINLKKKEDTPAFYSLLPPPQYVTGIAQTGFTHTSIRCKAILADNITA